jgi:hypothetical protein
MNFNCIKFHYLVFTNQLYIIGFFRALRRQLRIGVEEGTDILSILTHSMQKHHSEPIILRSPHFESTLRFQLVFEIKKDGKIKEQVSKYFLIDNLIQ